MPGCSELDNNINPYSVTKKEKEAEQRKTATQSTFAKTGAQQMGIQDAQVAGGLKELPEHKQKDMMNSYKAFYGVDENDHKTSKLSYSKLQ